MNTSQPGNSHKRFRSISARWRSIRRTSPRRRALPRLAKARGRRNRPVPFSTPRHGRHGRRGVVGTGRSLERARVSGLPSLHDPRGPLQQSKAHASPVDAITWLTTRTGKCATSCGTSLPEDVRMISGARKPLSMAQGTQQRFDAAFFTGYRAKIGEADASAFAYLQRRDASRRTRQRHALHRSAAQTRPSSGSTGTPVVFVAGRHHDDRGVATTLASIIGVGVEEHHRLLQCKRGHTGDGMCGDSRGRARSARFPSRTPSRSAWPRQLS